jgi:hypothetical protein
MTETQSNLTIRITLAPAGAEPPVRTPRGDYRWDRIIAVAVLLLLVVAGTIWLLRSPSSTPPAELNAERDAAAHTAGGRLDGSTIFQEADNRSDSGYRTSPEAASEPGRITDQSARPEVSDLIAAGHGPDQAVADTRTASGEGTSADSGLTAGDIPAGYKAGSEQLASSPTERGITDRAVTRSSSVTRDPPLTAIDTSIFSNQVRRFVITDAIMGREPVGGIEDIKPDRKVPDLVKVVAFSEVSGLGGRTLRYRWLRGDKVSATVPVRVGSDSWRSYTSKYINRDMVGRWRVELVTDSGDILATTEFDF